MFCSSSIESEIKKLYNSLSEKHKRKYAAIEAQKLGWGGISYIMKLCGCSRNTIVQVIKDLETMNKTTINNLTIGKKGGGRKSILATRSGIDEAFLEVLKFPTAGDPMNELLEFRLKNRERWLSEELEPPRRERMRVKNKTYPLPQ